MSKQTIFRTYTIVREQVASKKYDIGTNVIQSPGDAADIFREVFRMMELTQEILVLMTLDTKNKVIGLYEVHRGSLNASIVHPRDIFQRALLDNANSIMIGHNHPSGNSEPSQEDINVTRRVKDAGKIMGIELLDHIVIGDRYTSLREKGYF